MTALGLEPQDQKEPISPALNCKMRAASMLLTEASPLVSAPFGQGSEPSNPATNCRINAASMALTEPLQKIDATPGSQMHSPSASGSAMTETLSSSRLAT